MTKTLTSEEIEEYGDIETDGWGKSIIHINELKEKDYSIFELCGIAIANKRRSIGWFQKAKKLEKQLEESQKKNRELEERIQKAIKQSNLGDSRFNIVRTLTPPLTNKGGEDE